MATIIRLEPTTNGVDWTYGGYLLIIGIIDYGLTMVMFTCVLIILTAFFVYKMKRLKSIMIPSTFKLQVMLFKTLVVQTVLILITIAFPVLVIDFMLVAKFQNGSFYAQIAIFPLCIHALADTTTILYFIRPYRKYVVQMFKKVVHVENQVNGQQ
uniref:7TM GPCR serpentine receptor class x (Srx) domain-containing protein n=1 Tax=Acrobeloides nanus TaxID=290746 RepID=A0A914ENY4_9BILA